MESVQLPYPHRLRELVHDGAFWAAVVLIAMLCAAFILAIISSGGALSNEYYTPLYVP